jgi:hypothetical protein
VVPVLRREPRLGFDPEPVPVPEPVEPEAGTPVTLDAVEGRLELPAAFGGWGNEAMLIVRRRDLSGELGVRPLEAERTVLRLDVEFELESGERREGFGLEGVRNPEGL